MKRLKNGFTFFNSFTERLSFTVDRLKVYGRETLREPLPNDVTGSSSSALVSFELGDIE